MPTTPRVLIADNVHQDCQIRLEEAGIEVVRLTGKSEDELAEIVGEFEGIVVRSAVQVTARLIDAMSKGRVIGRAGAGVDNIDVAAATRAGIAVMNTPGGNTISAVEHTVGMILSAMRMIPQADQTMHERRWDRKSFVGIELYGKQVGIIGLGRIGREVAARLAAFEVTILGYDPHLSEESIRGLNIHPVELEHLLKTSDVITLHLPLTDETRNLIGEDELQMMKQGSVVVNCARGGIVNEEALCRSLQSGHLAAAALDVFEQEPPTEGSPVYDTPRLVLTPHIAASTEEAQQRVAFEIANEMIRFFAGEGANGLVNAGMLGEALKAENSPMMEASELLGRFLGQLSDSKPTQIGLRVYGDRGEVILEGLKQSFLSGFLGTRTKAARLNPINAAWRGAEEGITVDATGSGDHSEYTFLVEATIQGSEAHTQASVTLLGGQSPRIVSINGVPLDIQPSGNLLLLTNHDRPGVLSRISGVLGQHDLNIADIALGRLSDRPEATAIVRIDEEIDATVVDEIAQLEGVITVVRLHI